MTLWPLVVVGGLLLGWFWAKLDVRSPVAGSAVAVALLGVCILVGKVAA